MALYGSYGRSGPRFGVSVRFKKPIQFMPIKWDRENKFIMWTFFAILAIGAIIQAHGGG